ncbi:MULTISPECIES: PadR family transcriptional regulator [unclassified Sinorhizobium]|uniref:PadR family transcriptional regulator n=1 Tax=unclassified Sinorhizobium TaxID=2613772 RepID=UPI0035245297
MPIYRDYIGGMKHKHIGEPGRHDIKPGEFTDHHHGRHHRHLRGGRSRRFFDYGELRLLLLAMIAEKPRHGYELIKAIEGRMGGSYSPSPGVIYPTLAWLDDMGYALIQTEEAGRKRYGITAEGEAFLTANRAAVDELVVRASAGGPDGPAPVPAPVVRAMENLKLAMRLRLRRGSIDEHAAERIAAALDQAAWTVERC